MRGMKPRYGTHGNQQISYVRGFGGHLQEPMMERDDTQMSVNHSSDSVSKGVLNSKRMYASKEELVSHDHRITPSISQLQSPTA